MLVTENPVHSLRLSTVDRYDHSWASTTFRGWRSRKRLVSTVEGFSNALCKLFSAQAF
jgi:hypothetical protein